MESIIELVDDVGQILNMVDLALLTHDEPWFLELTGKFENLKQGRLETNSNNNFKWKLRLNNRFSRL